MTSETSTKPTGPLACTRCGDTDGPFTRDGLRETCTDRDNAETKLLNVLENGDRLDGSTRHLITGAYATLLLQRAGVGQ